MLIEYGVLDSEGNLTVVGFIGEDDEEGKFIIASKGGLPVIQMETPEAPAGYEYVPTGKYELSEDGKSIIPIFEIIEDSDSDDDEFIPFGLYGKHMAESLRFYMPENSLTVNSTPVRIENASEDWLLAGPGEWWCVVTCVNGKFVATAMLSDDLDEVASDTLYSFPIASVGEDGTFRQYAFGEVVLSGVEDFDRMTPFKLCATRYSDASQTKTGYRIFTPADGTVQYNGSYVEIEEANGGNFVEVDGDPGEGSLFSCYIVSDGSSATGHIIKGPPPRPGSINGLVASFPVASIAYGWDDGGVDDESSDSGEDSASDSSDGGETWGDFYDQQFVDSNEAPYDTVGSGMKRVVPFAVVALDDDSSSSSDSEEGWSYSDDESNSDSSDSSEEDEPVARIYLPENSLFVNSERVRIDNVKGSYLSVGEGFWWCVIRAYDDGAAVDEGNSAEFYATLAKGSERTPPLFGDSVFEFPVAEVVQGGWFRSFAYGEVDISGLKSIKSLVPFDIVAARYRMNGWTRTRYRAYTPPEGSVQYNGNMLPIEESVGNWTDLEVEEGTTRFCCYVVGRKAHLNNKTDKYGRPGVALFFPVADIGDEFEDESDDAIVGKISAVVAGVEHSNVERDLPGAKISVNTFATMLKSYTSDITILFDEEATVEGVKNAFMRAAKESDLAVLYVAGHGGCTAGNNVIALRDGYLRDVDIWNIVCAAKKHTFLVFDSCHSGSMYGPPWVGNMASSIRAIAESRGVPPSVSMLCWAGATDETVGWTNEATGGYFTKAIVANASPQKTYPEVWSGVEADGDIHTMDQHPEQTMFGSFWETSLFLEHEDESDDSSSEN